MILRDVCGHGRATHVDVMARDATAAAWLTPWLRDVTDDASDDLDEAAEGPRITLVVGSDPSEPILEARCDGASLVLHAPRAPMETDSPLRRASVDEAFALALSWSLGAHRLGCFDPRETLFRGAQTHAEAWVLAWPEGEDQHGAFHHALGAARGHPLPHRADGLVQIWCNSSLLRSDRIDAVSRLFGTEDADAWAVLEPPTPLPGRASHPHVLIAALVVSAPCRP